MIGLFAVPYLLFGLIFGSAVAAAGAERAPELAGFAVKVIATTVSAVIWPVLMLAAAARAAGTWVDGEMSR